VVAVHTGRGDELRQELKLDPPRALHLAMDGARELRLTIFKMLTPEDPDRDAANRDHTYEDVTSRCELAFDPPAPQIANFDAATGRLTAVAAGTCRIRARLRLAAGGGFEMDGLHPETTLTVHAAVADWWLGNGSFTLPRTADLDHGQISIHAHFDPPAAGVGTIADITGHGYVDLTSADPATVALDANRRGRMRGLRTGHTSVGASFRGQNEVLDVDVVDRYAEVGAAPPRPRPVLHRVVYRGPPSTKANILFLAEGFTAADEALFDSAVFDIAVSRMFRLPRHSPFPQLSPDCNIWSAFDASRESGITFGPRVTGATTLPAAGAARVLLDAANSAYGLYWPRRPEDDVGEDPGAGSYASPLRGDPRRYPLEVGWVRALNLQIASLADPQVADPADPEHRVGVHWRNGGKDYGLVCILVRDNSFRAENVGPFVIVPLFDQYRWGFERAAPGAREQRWKVRRSDAPTPSGRTIALAVDTAGDVVPHEFGHSLVLGDEYEEDGGTRWLPAPGGNVEDPPIGFDNLVTPTDVNADVLPGFTMNQRVEIDPARIKWGSLHRVAQGDAIRAASWDVPSTAAMQVTLTLDEDPTRRWGPVQSANRDVFIRELLRIHDTTRMVDFAAPLSQQVLTLPRANQPMPTVIAGARITAIRAAERQLVLSVPLAALPPSMQRMTLDGLQTLLPLLLVPGSVVYLPNRDAAGTPRPLIEPDTTAWMARTHNPLSSNFDPAAGCAPSDQANPDYPPADLPAAGHSLPRHTFTVIGLYEGGDHKSCRVYRPAGFCKMRSQDREYEGRPGTPMEGQYLEPELCFVCKYLIVNRVNPRRLEEIDREYPELTARRGRRP
jgi:hypothetical protein